MPLGLVSPIRDRERILTMGVQGTGKSKSFLDIIRKLPPTHRGMVCDIDYTPSFNRLIDLSYPELGEDRCMVEPCDPEDWEEIMRAIKKFSGMATKDDWLCIDSMSHTWSAVQSWFIEQVHGDQIEDYFLDVRKKKAASKDDKKALGALDGWMDWPVINKQYFTLYRAINRFPGHVYMTAEQTSVNEKEDGKEVKGLFGPYGVKPVGQKRLGFVPATVLMLNKSRAGVYSVTTIKDRGRPEVEDRPLSDDFAQDYLIGLAGWKRKPVAA